MIRWCIDLIIHCLSLREFDGTSDLHTGISNTTGGAPGSKVRLILEYWLTVFINVHLCVCLGVVFNYTRGGVSKDHSGWERCVSVPLVRPDRFHLLAQWDQYLDRFSNGPMWDPIWHRFTHT